MKRTIKQIGTEYKSQELTKSVPVIKKQKIEKLENSIYKSTKPLLKQSFNNEIFKNKLTDIASKENFNISNVKQFCIGFDKQKNSIYITYRSKYALLCSKNIKKAMVGSNLDNCLVNKTTNFCLCDYQCKCNYIDGNLIGNEFSLDKCINIIDTHKYTETYLVLSVNGMVIDRIYVKKIAPSVLKRCSQPSTCQDSRISISQNIKILFGNNIQLNIFAKNKNKNFGIGIGYIFYKNDIRLGLSLIDVDNTVFKVSLVNNAYVNNIQFNIEKFNTKINLFSWKKNVLMIPVYNTVYWYNNGYTLTPYLITFPSKINYL